MSERSVHVPRCDAHPSTFVFVIDTPVTVLATIVYAVDHLYEKREVHHYRHIEVLGNMLLEVLVGGVQDKVYRRGQGRIVGGVGVVARLRILGFVVQQRNAVVVV